ncbi:pentatricopeptide repeat-containing protein At5g66520-like isoform X2 [Phalaenopsis equestris]|uniref:pentatricopeptide repeat-containing protein At5g66520-like isoform X2 n=1 Tax=Phalaenopsis equestris TaxID=78828 RepID=UPI0009E3CA88|nr:pentatricopeptide repeat-containing protein At5g66520-like isoform X2 [Phalaenopsis equestris]
MAVQHSKVVSSTLKAVLTGSPTVSINLCILEECLRKCQIPKDFLQIHAQLSVSGLINDSMAASRLLSFSANSHFLPLDHSLRILDQAENPNAFCWNTIMRAYVRRNLPQSCLSLYRSMLKSGLVPDNFTHPIVLQACSLRFCLREAYVQIGDVDESVYIFDNMPEQNTIASNSMIALFGRSKLVEDARKLFDEMTLRDTVSWTAMISCYEQNKMFREALELFNFMRGCGIPIDEVVLVSVLSACASLGTIKEGEAIHGLIIRIGIQTYLSLMNSLSHMYSSYGNIDAAELLFDSSYSDQISWNIMISGYLKCGFVDKARRTFHSMPHKDLVSWSTIISGYAQHGSFSDTLNLFHEMQIRGIRPDETTLVSVISACTNLSALEQGRWVHAYVRKHAFRLNLFLGTTLIDMYMKFGCTETALEIFDEMEEKSVSTWNAVILGLAMNGFFKEALEKFSHMERHGVLPNEITFVGVLGACRHGGLVAEGRDHFNSMKHVYNLEPNVKHYGCIVDLLGRAGLLNEAEEVITYMPIVPDVSTWGALLGACKKYGNNEIGERLGRKLIELEPEHDGFHVLLSNMYASKGKWDDLMEIRSIMKRRKVVKTPGCSIIEADGIVHEFLSGDDGHPQMNKIEEMLNEMARKLKMEGYEANTAEVAFDIENEEKESSLYRHSEKLAIAFGLINTKPSVPIRIMKNLRICSDCHAAAKILSKAFEREIVVRDRHRFHHFKQGVCSCTDYW